MAVALEERLGHRGHLPFEGLDARANRRYRFRYLAQPLPSISR